MKVDVYDMKGKKLDQKADLPAQIFEAEIKTDLMHQAYVRQMANARQGNHKTKTRAEVRGGGAKPWRQKGTGRARHGSRRSPIWVGGGRAHGPQPRSYAKKMPRKMRRAALRSALSVKAADKEIVVVDAITLPEPKTRLMAEALEKLVGDGSALILLPEKGAQYDTVVRSAKNLPTAKTVLANYISIRDLLGHDKVIVSLQSLDVIKGFLG